MVLTFNFFISVGVKDWIFLLRRLVSGKLYVYTSLATVFMSAAATISPTKLDSESLNWVLNSCYLKNLGQTVKKKAVYTNFRFVKRVSCNI